MYTRISKGRSDIGRNEEKRRKMTDIITLGELLIDLTQKGEDENGNGKFTAFPGGAPANVAVAASKLGASTGFIGKVGNDAFGRKLAETLSEEGVNTDGLLVSDDVPTTLAIVSVDPTGEREFTFYRDPGADTQITAIEAIAALSEEMPKVLHIGSLSMTTSPSKEACEAAVRYAKEKGALISYDPNYRAALWDSEEHAIEMMKVLLPLTDILKVSDEEMEMLTGTKDYSEGCWALAECGIRLIMVTLGAEGVFVKYGDYEEHIPGFSVKVADTNGAGDTFLGAMLYRIAQREDLLDGMSNEELRTFVTYANKAASLTCSRHGAMPAMPTADELK